MPLEFQGKLHSTNEQLTTINLPDGRYIFDHRVTCKKFVQEHSLQQVSIKFSGNILSLQMG